MIGGYKNKIGLLIPADSLIVFGDSISVQIFGGVYSPGTIEELPSPNYQEKIRTAYPGNFPLVFNAAVAGTYASQGDAIVDGILSGNPDPGIVPISFGTNDAGNAVGTSAYSAAKVLAAGKTPIIPSIPYASQNPWRDAIPAYNAIVTGTLWGISGVRQGPDLNTYFQANQGELSGDGVHLSQTGLQSALDLWVAAMAWAYP
jgi:hypothetical protein